MVPRYLNAIYNGSLDLLILLEPEDRTSYQRTNLRAPVKARGPYLHCGLRMLRSGGQVVRMRAGSMADRDEKEGRGPPAVGSLCMDVCICDARDRRIILDVGKQLCIFKMWLELTASIGR